MASVNGGHHGRIVCILSCASAVFFVLVRDAWAHDCSSEDDCAQVMQNHGWLMGVLAGILAWLGFSKPDKETDCHALAEYRESSARGVDYYKKYLAGEMSWEELASKRTVDGRAFMGTTEAGATRPAAVQDAITEFEFSGASAAHIPDAAAALFKYYTSDATDADLTEYNRAQSEWEIERHNAINDILDRRRRERGCK